MTALTGDIGDYRRDYHEQVGIVEAFQRAFSNYATVEGRATRGEYWWFAVAAFLVNISAQAADWMVFGVMDGGFPVLSIAWALVSFLPSLALTVRRLHDLDRSGWYFLIMLIPLVGPILFIVRMATRGEASPNRFG